MQPFLIGKIMNDIKEQIKEFNKLIKKYPDIQELYIGRAILYTKIKQYKKALEDYRKGCENYICYDIFNICRRNGLIKDAEEFCTNKIKKESSVMNYSSRARFYMSIGENKKALADCETILKMEPENKFILGVKEVLDKKLKDEQKKLTVRRKIKPVFL